MAQTAADVLVEGIIDWGVDTVFGLPGDGINGIMEALRQRRDRVRFIQVRHEEAAAFMACAYAKYTGRLGCCLATSGPGGIHLLNGLYDAKLDQAPVLAITGQTYSDPKGSRFQQEINMTLLFEDVTVYNQEVINPDQVEMLVNEACRHALNHRGVSHITFPVDYQEKEPSGRGSLHKVEGSTTSRWSPPINVPPEDELRLAALILNQAKRVQIDDRADRVGLRFPVEVGLVGDAKQTVAALSRFIERKEDRSFLEQAQEGMKEWWELMRTRAVRDDVPIKPQRVAWELSELAADDAIISTDSGTITTWIARQFKIRKNQKFSCSGTLATMAPGLPYSIAAKVAYPERQSIAFVGDGGFTMLMCEFLTAVKYDLPVVVVIIKNNTLGQIKWEQIVFLGNPEYGCELHNPDFAKYAEACGGPGFTVERPEEIRPTLERALSSGRPSVVEVVVDPFEPPMPPKVSAEQALLFAEALVKGQPAGGKIALTLFRDKLSELF